MKTIQKLTALFILLTAITSLHACDKIRIILNQPPPNKMGVGDMWNLELYNTTNKEIKIYLTGTATEEKDYRWRPILVQYKLQFFSCQHKYRVS